MSIRNQIDEREPKEILKSEIYLTAPMIRRILNCTYNKALNIISAGLEKEKQERLYIVKNQRKKQIRTTTFKEMTNL